MKRLHEVPSLFLSLLSRSRGILHPTTNNRLLYPPTQSIPPLLSHSRGGEVERGGGFSPKDTRLPTLFPYRIFHEMIQCTEKQNFPHQQGHWVSPLPGAGEKVKPTVLVLVLETGDPRFNQSINQSGMNELHHRTDRQTDRQTPRYLGWVGI